MAIANTLREYLDYVGVPFELIAHPHTSSSNRSAAAAHVPGDQMAKSVVLRNDHGYLMAVIPATHRLDLDRVEQQLHRQFDLVEEQTLHELFFDCETGSVPPLGEAYGVKVMYDECMANSADIYFEGGDHSDLVHISGDDFRNLMSGCVRGKISHHV